MKVKITGVSRIAVNGVGKGQRLLQGLVEISQWKGDFLSAFAFVGAL